MNPFAQHPSNQGQASRPAGLRARGITIESVRLVHPVTGEIIPLRRKHAVLIDGQTGLVVNLREEETVMCVNGDVIDSRQGLAVCSGCLGFVCRIHGITCLCGRTFCSFCSVPILLDDVPFRLCAQCYDRIMKAREGFLRRVLRGLFGVEDK